MILSKIIKVIKKPGIILVHMCQHWPFRCISDESYLKLFFRVSQGKKLDLNNPVTFNAKLQWLKLYDRKPEYTLMTDKYLVREYIKEKIGEEYLIPLLGVWDDANEIDFDKLPEQFVLKCNHDSGSVYVCKNKAEMNKKAVIKKMNKSLKSQYYWASREWNYHDIVPKVIAEQYMVDESGCDLKDYKFFCFDGVPKFIQVDVGRFTNHRRNFYTANWEFIPVEYGCANDANLKVEKPELLDKMKELASILSKEMSHLRVDFYIVQNQIYFGELTFHHGGGVMYVNPSSYDELWGSYLKLPNNR